MFYRHGLLRHDWARPGSRIGEVPFLFPSDPFQRPLPDPIPESLYARPHRAAQAGMRTPVGRCWVSGFRRWPLWKQAMAAIAAIVGLVSTLQIPWKPALGLLGLLTIAAVTIAIDVWGFRARLPLLSSMNPRVSATGYGLIAGFVLLGTILVLVAPSSPSSSHQHVSRPASSPLQGVAPPPVSLIPTPTPSPSPTRSPAPAAVPPAAPRGTSRPTAAAVTLLNAPLSVQRGQAVTLSARTASNVDCSIDIGYPSAPQLGSATSDDAGNVSWTWRVGKHVPVGTWPITVSCASGTASTQISVS